MLAVIAPEGKATLSVDVTNTGSREGDEMVKMYVHHRVSPITRPVIELKGFRRITLNLGQKTTVQFKITPELLADYDLNMRRVVAPGTVDLRVGSSSTQTVSTSQRVAAS